MRRKHSKIMELPTGIRQAVDQLLASGFTYEQIADELESRGHKVSRSSVGRYAADVAEAAKELTVITEQLRPVLEKIADSPNIELGTVAGQMGLMQVIRFLKSGQIEDEKSKAMALAAICQAAAQLQRAGGAVEQYRMQWREKKQRADKDLEKVAGKRGWTPEIIKEIKQCYDL